VIEIEIKGKLYQVCNQWEDLTLKRFIELSEVPIPERLERLWIASANLNGQGNKKLLEAEYEKAINEVSHEDLVKHFPAFYGKVIEVLSDIPAEIIDRIHGDLRTQLYDDHLSQFVLSLIYSAPVDKIGGKIDVYEPEPINSFKVFGEEFFFPKSLRLYNDIIPMAEEKTITFAEAADIDIAMNGLRTEGIKRLPVFMGIYCRKEGEEYDEQAAIRRQEVFLNVTMNIVWALFFYTVKLTYVSQSFILTYLKRVVEAVAPQITEPAD